ncbi:MAG: hypothetical protein H6748_07115 [Spirochaetaceae bacterium]|nr:hypothetical protein [Myxococcales bacterium]MCB9723795.1 hypothetical protein [Spirochaetaceae bacterium]HPG24644.1 hypothetical protein [Myxococcota bacterium]
MKGAIANLEIYAFERVETPGAGPRRLSLAITAPERREEGGGWACRVALADLHRPRPVEGRDSFEALAAAVACARDWIEALEAEGYVLFRDRAGERRLELP